MSPSEPILVQHKASDPLSRLVAILAEIAARLERRAVEETEDGSVPCTRAALRVREFSR